MIAKSLLWTVLAALLAGAFLPAAAQDRRQPKILLDVPEDSLWVPSDSLRKPFALPDRFLIPSSEKLYIRTFRLSERIHYAIDYEGGTVQLIADLPATDSLLIVYRAWPFPLVSDYFHRELQVAPPPDSGAADSGTVAARAVAPGFLDDLDSYQSNLQKSGSIVRGIEIGSNQDLSLNSGLNLQLSGQIAPQVELVAALTDESTPIQPEGNTQTLREVDKVFVTITAPHVGGTLGDFQLQYQNSLFGNLQRKLQGVTVENRFRDTRQQVTFGTSRGIFHSNRFLAQEGNQGPYLLTGRNGEREIIVLAGTEKVFVDGVEQIRGENNDYVIDYGLAQITFTSRKLITSENRIEVDFEYTNSFQRYGRNFVGASTQGKGIGQRFNYDLRLFQEWDDTNNLLEDDAQLSDAETAVLREAGDNPLAATVSGAEFVGTDSLGVPRGDYTAVIDTLVNDTLMTVYRYAGPNQGEYRVRFSGVGQGNGDYRRISLGRYEFVGPGRGQYLPVRLVPLASKKRFADLSLGYRITPTWSIDGEVAVSDLDRNVFSGLGDGDNQGGGFQLATTLADSTLRLGGADLGALRLNARWRRQEETFEPLDRLLQPEYAFKWNLGGDALRNREESVEATASYLPVPQLRFSGNMGRIDKGGGLSSFRRQGEVALQKTWLPESRFSLETVESSSPSSASDWRRRQFRTRRPLGPVTPRYEYQYEDRTVDNLADTSLTGFRFREHLGGVGMGEMAGVRWDLSARERIDYLYDPARRAAVQELAVTRTYQVSGELNELGNLRGQMSLAYRDKNFRDFFERLPDDSLGIYQPDAQFQDTSWTDRQSHLARFDLQYRNTSRTLTARWDYKVASELQALREKVYLEVGEANGNFRFDSTINEYVPDPQGDLILVQLQTGDFESVTNLESAVQVQYRPSGDADMDGVWDTFRKRISTLSYAKVIEQSRSDDILDLYLLRLDRFHNLQSSLRGVYILNQDVTWNERNPVWGLLLRMRYRDNLSNQFLDAENNETRITAERIVQGRRRLFERTLNVTAEYRNGRTKRWVAANPSRNLDIASQVLATELNYRPTIAWQIQLAMERGWERDRRPVDALAVNFWEVKPQVAFSLRGKARATADLTFLQVAAVENPGERPLPFEIGKGKKTGNSWLWNLRFEYFLSNNVTINATYNGRRDATALRTLHLGQAEVRAFF